VIEVMAALAHLSAAQIEEGLDRRQQEFCGGVLCDGVTLTPNKGTLTVDAPAGVLTPALVEILKVRKPELIAVLSPGGCQNRGRRSTARPASDLQPG
jgi:hypothetical protein